MKEKRRRPDIQKDIEVLQAFIGVYCEKNHARRKGDLCQECNSLLHYGVMKLEKCPYDPKPKCKDCETHCYQPQQRAKVQEVMRFSGMHFVKRGRLDWLWKYFS